MGKINEFKEYISDKFNFSDAKTFEFFYNSGIDAYDKKNYEKAIKLFKEALEQTDVKPQVYYNLGLCYHSVNDYNKAIAAYKKFLELNPDDYDGLYNIALVYYIKKNYSKSVEFFEKSVEINMEEDSVKSLTLAYLSNNEMQKALDFAERIFKFEKNGMYLYSKIAKVFETKNSLSRDFTYVDAAIEMYSGIIEKDENYFDAYISKSICYAKKGEWENSLNFCQKALEKNPQSYEANNQMGLVYYCRDEIEEAVNYYENALKLKPEGDYKVYSNLAYAYEKMGEKDKAIKVFEQLIRKFPNIPAIEEIKNHLRILKNFNFNTLT